MKAKVLQIINRKDNSSKFAQVKISKDAFTTVWNIPMGYDILVGDLISILIDAKGNAIFESNIPTGRDLQIQSSDF